MTDVRKPVSQVFEVPRWKRCAQGAPYSGRGFNGLDDVLASMGRSTSNFAHWGAVKT